MDAKKVLMVGGLLALGGLAYYMLTKPRRNSDGFFSADGTMSGVKSSSPCRICEGSDGVGYFAVQGRCKRSDSCRQTIRQFQTA